jgi:hypothetical protein
MVVIWAVSPLPELCQLNGSRYTDAQNCLQWVFACETVGIIREWPGTFRQDSSMGKKMQKPRRGRPPKHGTTKRSQFNTRLQQEVKERLEAAAQAAGRSLSEEIERRLEQTLEDERRSGGAHLHSVLRLFSGVAALIEARKGKRFLDDPDTYVQVRSAWDRILDASRDPRMAEAATQRLAELEEARKRLQAQVDVSGPADAQSIRAQVRAQMDLAADLLKQLQVNRDLGTEIAESILEVPKKSEQ